MQDEVLDSEKFEMIFYMVYKNVFVLQNSNGIPFLIYRVTDENCGG